MYIQHPVIVIKLSDVYNRSECAVQYRHRSSCDRMMSIEQLSLMVKRHLGLHTYLDELQCSTKWAIFDSPLGGRGLIATEDIKSGEVLFVDHPLVHGPRSGTTIQRGCTVCSKIDSVSAFKCSRCALLLCSEQCQNSDVHFSDCNIISCWPNKVPIEDVDDTLLSRALTAIRALLINEEQRNLLRSLQAHVLPQHGSEIRNLKEFFDIPMDIEEFMTYVSCVLDANAFQVATPYGKNEMNLRALYPVSALMNHNCVPNTRSSFNADSQMSVKAVKTIRAGSEIFTCYSGLLWGTPARRLHLYKTKHFLCTCERCADPTERGTLLAALKCFSTECAGSLLPMEPLKLNTSWRCLDCALIVPNSNICAVQSALGSLVGCLDFENIIDLENFLFNRITKFIPKTSQIVVDLHCRLIWNLGELNGFRWNEEQKLVLSIFQRSDAESSFAELDLLRSKYEIPERQIEFIKIIDAATKINSFRISDCPTETKIHLRGLYPLSAFMNHNCVPNTRNIFKKDYSMAVYATKDIKASEEISSCYTGLLWCNPVRRYQLYKSKKLWCNCNRCMDKTKLGTKLSALKCLEKNCSGDMLPSKPLDPRSDWVCDNCDVLVSHGRINIIQSVLGSLVGLLTLDNEFQLESAILKRLVIFASSNNHIFVDIKLRLAIKLGFEGDCIINGIIK